MDFYQEAAAATTAWDTYCLGIQAFTVGDPKHLDDWA